jgi:Peptidase family M23
VLFGLDVGARQRPAFGVRFGRTPTAVDGGNGQRYLAYELHLAAMRADVTLESVQVFDGMDLLLTYDAEALAGRMMRPEMPRTSRYGRLVPAGATAVVSIWLPLPASGRRLGPLRHELQAITASMQAVLDLVGQEPLRLGAPFRDGLWLAHNGPGDHRAAHWGSMLVDGRRITVPQRYAIDFMGLDDAGRGVRGALEGSANRDWPGFGREVVAVADGVVQSARDGVPDNPPLFEPGPPPSVELAAIAGNYVVLDLGRRRYVHYLHLQQGSVAVRRGQRVRRGGVVGRLGNSGNTNGAHLHFNVVDNIRLTNAEGLPYVFDTYLARGTTSADAIFSETPTAPQAPTTVREGLPLNGSLVEFVRT